MNPEAQDQGARIEAVFAGIATTRMAGVPVLNPALGVAMRGWQAVEPFELGVLVTPWFMNLLAVGGRACRARGRKGASGAALGRL
jgi:[NiFe] hydrogenase assembly HybE family chaperone